MINEHRPVILGDTRGHDPAPPGSLVGSSPLTDLAADLKTQFADKPLEVFEQILGNFNHRVFLVGRSAFGIGTHDVPPVRSSQVETEGWTTDHDDEHE